MVEPAREVKDTVRLAVEDELGGPDGAAGHELGQLPQAWEDRIVPRAKPVACGVGHPVSRADGAKDLEVLADVEARDRLDRGGRRRLQLDGRARREPVRFHEPPGEAEPLHAKGVLAAVVEAAPFLRVHERRVPRAHRFFRRHTPDFPPDFSWSARSVSTTPRSTAFTMS